MDFIEKEGPSVPEAVFAAVRALGIEEKDAQVQVLSGPGARRVRVRVGRPGAALPAAVHGEEAVLREAPGDSGPRESQRRGPPEAAAGLRDRTAEQGAPAPVRRSPDAAQARRAAEDLERLLAAMGTPGSVEVKERSGNLVLNVQSPQHESLLIGRRGQTLDALRVLINEFMAHREGQEDLYVLVDVADYHGRQEQRLIERAVALAQQVLRDGGEANMGTLSSAERRVAHMAVKALEGVESFSVGQGSTKKLVIRKM